MPSRSFSVGHILSTYGTILVTVVVIGLIWLQNPAFVSAGQIQNLLQTAAPLAILAIGVTMTLVVAEFDLSFAANMTFGAVLCGVVLTATSSPVLAALAAVGGCIVVGAINGILVAFVRISGFIATLAMSGLLLGLCYKIGGYNTTTMDASFTTWATFKLAGLPVMLIVAIVLAVAVWLFLERTFAGRDFYAVGGNPEAARLRGVRLTVVRFSAFTFMGAISGIAAIILASSLGSISVSTMAGNYLLNALACAFLGTAVLRPGQIHVIGTLVGVVLVTVLISGMTFTNVPYTFQSLIVGGVLLAAVCFSRLARRG